MTDQPLIPTIRRLERTWSPEFAAPQAPPRTSLDPLVLPHELHPGAAEPPATEVSRRAFLQLLGASLALAGLGAGCTAPEDEIRPYVTAPPEATPGRPLHYATTMTVDGYGTGLLVESHGGRPTKVEGNPDHPASLGAAGIVEQALVLGLYDPFRAKHLTCAGGGATWPAFVAAFGPGSPAARDGGRRLRLLLEPAGSPLLAEWIARFEALYPGARVHVHSALARDAVWEGARLALGRPLETLRDLRRAAVVLALDADFLAAGPSALRDARGFAEARRVLAPTDPMSRLYAVEGRVTITGTSADHRLRCASDEVEVVARAVLAEALRALPAGAAPAALAAAAKPWLDHPAHGKWAAAVARDLARHAGAALVVAGDRQPPAVHAIAHALNAALGATGHTMSYVEPAILRAGDAGRGLAPLCDAIAAGEVEALVVLGGNPAFTAPADLDLAKRLRSVARTAYLGLHENETARACGFFLPAAHDLESWGDARAADGTVSPVQPLVAPLYGGRTAVEVLAALAGEPEKSAHDLLRESWQRRFARDDFESFWQASLARGVVEGSAAKPVDAAPRWPAIAAAVAKAPPAPAAGALELDLVPDARILDGRFSDNPWLLELPDPVTKLTWENAALVGPALAKRLALESGDRVLLKTGDASLALPALVVPGQAEDVVAVSLGFGRAATESAARGIGADAFGLRTSAAPHFARGLAVEKIAGPRRALAITQAHFAREGRPTALERTLEEFRAEPGFAEEHRARPPSLYKPHEYTGNQWAMAIDLTLCTGCSACVVACQSENNTPVVGRDEVLVGRAMHWLRLDRYRDGPADEPASIASQPMMCQHCELAPCEYACPVNATSHGDDGLNEMTYNRCVGTRFCSNNCPYKVRRFNWFDYNQGKTETERMAMNPDVTVRGRGVMEKCTYCVQRIREAEIRARVEGREIRDGEFQTACQQACPSRAIVFGSIGDPASEVARLRESPRAYAELNELGTVPRTRYLARIRNVNPELGEKA